jgi:hypothetical protein
MPKDCLVAAHGGDLNLYDKMTENQDPEGTIGITQEQWCAYMKVARA